MHIFLGKDVLPPKVDWAPTLWVKTTVNNLFVNGPNYTHYTAPCAVSVVQHTFPIDDVLFHSKVIRRRVGSCPKSCLNFTSCAPNFEARFLNQFLKLHSLPNMWKSSVAIGREPPRLRVEKRRKISSKTWWSVGYILTVIMAATIIIHG